MIGETKDQLLKDGSLDYTVALVHGEFERERSSGKRSLIIFDNAPANFIGSSLKGYIPGSTDILITSKQRGFEHEIDLAIDPNCILLPEEGLRIFRERLELDDTASREAKRIVKKFHNMPVAIAQAVNYLHKTKRGVEEYLPLFEANKQEVFKLGALEETIEIYTSINMAIKTLSPSAKHFLSQCTYLPCDNIPKKLLERLAQGPLKLDFLIAEIQTLATPDKETLSLHALVQDIIQLTVNQSNSEEKIVSELSYIAGEFAEFLQQDPSKAIPIFEAAIKIERNEEGKTILLDNIGHAYLKLIKYKRALKYYIKALYMKKKLFSDKHPSIATSLNNIGYTFSALGNYQEALKYKMAALKMRTDLLGNYHLDVATSLDSVGYTFSALGSHEKALKYLIEALQMREELLGNCHLDVATSLNNTGYTFSALGCHLEALKYKMNALKIRKELLGDKHLSIATSLNSIGYTFSALGSHQEALKYKMNALEMRKELLGDNHPDVATSLNNVGYTLSSLGNHQKALKYKVTALEIRKKLLGVNHPDVATSLNSIGLVFVSLCDYQKALNYFTSALEIREKFLGKNHPNAALSLNNVIKTQKKLEEAKAMQKRLEEEENPPS